METLFSQHLPSKGPIFTREILGDTLVLSPHAPLGNLHEAEISEETQELLKVINHVGPTNLVIDLQSGTYLGTAFLGATVRLWKRIGERGGRLALCNVAPQVFELLRITKLHTIWPIYSSRDEALHAVAGHPGEPRPS